MLRSFHAPAMAQAPGRHARRARFSRARLLLLLAVQGAQAATGHLHDLEADARDVADGVAAAAEAGDEDLVVLVDEVQAAVPGHEGRDLLAVLDQLHAAALPDGGVRLLCLNADLLHDDALGVRGASERIALVLGPQVGLLVVLVSPELRPAPVDELARAPDPAGLGAAHGSGVGLPPRCRAARGC